MIDLLETALRQVAAPLGTLSGPWWVIGSAAVALHGANTSVSDIDVLVEVDDAVALVGRWGLPNLANDDGLFRSDVYARWTGAALPVEFMAGLRVRGEPVRFRTRLLVGGIPVPDRNEMRDLLLRFGRPKDLARAALLD